MNQKFKLISVQARRFFAEADPATAVVDPSNPNPNPNPNPGNNNPNPNPTPGPGQKTYSEDDFNRLLNTKIADERRRAQEQNKKTVEQLQRLQQDSALTQQQRTELQNRIDELETTYRTAEETKKIEIGKWEEKYKKDTAKLGEERDSWRGRFETHLKKGDITRSASKHEAVNAEQIEAWLLPRTRVVDELGADGKPTGEMVTRVKFDGIDKENKPITLDLSVDDAVKAMKDWPERFGNLFRSTANGGIGANPNVGPVGNGRLPDIETMTPQQYAEKRKEIRAAVSAQRG